jgi:hypothetical protein
MGQVVEIKPVEPCAGGVSWHSGTAEHWPPKVPSPGAEVNGLFASNRVLLHSLPQRSAPASWGEWRPMVRPPASVTIFATRGRVGGYPARMRRAFPPRALSQPRACRAPRSSHLGLPALVPRAALGGRTRCLVAIRFTGLGLTPATRLRERATGGETVGGYLALGRGSAAAARSPRAAGPRAQRRILVARARTGRAIARAR